MSFDPTVVHGFLERSAEQFPDKTAIAWEGEHLSYASLNDLADRFATGAVDLGVERGDRVVILLDTGPEIVIAMYGALKAGGVFSILHGTTKAKKLAYILQNAEPELLVTHSRKAAVIKEAFALGAPPCRIAWVGDPAEVPADVGSGSVEWDSWLTASSGNPAELPRVVDVDLAALIYTSGSTGDAKAVMSTHANIVAAARSIVTYVGNQPDDIVLNLLPMSFDYGLYQVIMTFTFGGTVVLAEGSATYLHKVLTIVEQERVTGLPVVPTLVGMLLRMKDLGKYDFSSVRYLTNTGAALPVPHIRRLQEILPNAEIFSMFGLTECKRVAYLPPEELSNRPASVGKAMPGCEVMIVDPDGNEVPPGVAGELVVRGSNVMQGYWRQPEVTSRTFRPGRYPSERLLYTGDLFKQDDEGYLYFIGRKDDMIKTRGERVGTKEVEAALCDIEGVAEAAIVGVPDELLGQAISAFVVLIPGSELDEKDVLRGAKERLEVFMVPKHVTFVDGLPKTAHAKVDRAALTARAVEISS